MSTSRAIFTWTPRHLLPLSYTPIKLPESYILPLHIITTVPKRNGNTIQTIHPYSMFVGPCSVYNSKTHFRIFGHLIPHPSIRISSTFQHSNLGETAVKQDVRNTRDENNNKTTQPSPSTSVGAKIYTGATQWWQHQLSKNYIQLLSYSTYPNMPHIPSRREIIASVQGFWTRQHLRVRLFLTGHLRPWKANDFVALFSWMLVGNLVWILIGTTTFVSLILFIANSVQGQEWLARKLSTFLAAETGILITFESAIVPRWKDGTIRFKNVNVKLDGDTYQDILNAQRKRNREPPLSNKNDVNLNWTYWDVNIQTADVSLSLWRWLDGKGIIQQASINGVRGTINREHIHRDPTWIPTRREQHPGDFDIENFHIEDVLLEIRNPGFRPYNLSIYHGDAPRLRMQWLLYDLLCADAVVGMFDGCLFSVHKPQTMEGGEDEDEDEMNTSRSRWAKMSHFKISGVPIQHVNQNAQGPFGWINGGTLDLDVHILIPQVIDHTVLAILKEEIQELRTRALEFGDKAASSIEGVIRVPVQYDTHRTSYHHGMDVSLSTIINENKDCTHGHKLHDVVTPSSRVLDDGTRSKLQEANYSDILFTPPPPPTPDDPPYIRFFFDVRLNDLKASIPLDSPDLTYLNSAWVRPVVAYMNANRTITPMVFGVQMDLNNFDGAQTIYSSGLADVLAEEVGRCFIHLVTNESERAKRLRRVGLWTLQSVSKNIVTLTDYLRGNKGFPEFVKRGSMPYG